MDGSFCPNWVASRAEAHVLRIRGSGSVAEKSRRFVFGRSEEISRNCSPVWSFERMG